MKQIYSLLLILTTVFFFACQKDDDALLNGKGYLRLQVGQNAELNTKAEVSYSSERIAVYIKDSENKIVKQTTDFDGEWKGKEIELPVGEYTIEAESYGWDGEAGEDKAYYKGSTTVTIKAGEPATAEVLCYLANVKVTVAFDQDFLTELGDGTITVQVQNVNGQTTYKAMDFAKSSEKQVAYFAATDLDVKYTVNTDKGKNSETYEIRNVKAKDHYILNFRLPQTGTGDFTVTVDPAMTTYEYTFNVSTVPTNNATISTGTWDRVAYLSANAVTTATGVSTEGIKFQYREKLEDSGAVATKATEEEENNPWIDVETTEKDGKYTAMITGLTPSKEYEYRLVNVNEEVIGSVQTFTTAAESSTASMEQLQNAGFEDWYQANRVWYAASQSNYTSGNYLWDSSNPGSGSFGYNPTTQSTEVKHGGNSSAKLETQYAYIKLAAASLYYGRFNGLVGINGAKIDFGQPFTSRPVAFKGYFQYKPVAIDHVGSNQPANTVSKGDTDQCSIFIILSKGQYQVDNTKTETLLTAENIWDKDQFIAYGELPADQCVNTNGEWQEFNIPLKYKEGQFGEQPTHLIIVCSSSKYGDYFTGGTGSTLYLDDFSLVYDGTPQIWEGVE